ncbi:MAG: hypothetical protein RIG77_12420 [Cyclobacteriaceae bacterium]
MSKYYCHKCNNEVSPKAKKCTNCGLKLTPRSGGRIQKDKSDAYLRIGVAGVGVIVLILIVYAFTADPNVEYDNSSNYHEPKSMESENDNSEPDLIEPEVQSKNDIFRFRSTFYDEEINGIVTETYEGITYHTFDMNRRIVKYKELNSNGKWKTDNFKMIDFSKEEGILLSTFVISVDHPIVKEVWFTEADNLGYDLHNGKRFSYYGVQRIE